MKRVAVFGITGQLGRALTTRLESSGVKVLGFDRKACDFSQSKLNFENVLGGVTPDWVISSAAYTDVARAETEPSIAMTANAENPAALARYCASRKIPFVTYSTDYVFDGNKGGAYIETDPVNPMNEYGKSKAEGEKKILAAGGAALVFRTSWVYSHVGKNFLLTMLKLGAERTELQIVSDQIGAPTFAPDLADATVNVMKTLDPIPWEQKSGRAGLFHVCNTGHTSWYGFAELIFKSVRARGWPLKVNSLKPVLTKDYNSPVARPLNSVLSTEKLRKDFGVTLRDFRNALENCLDELDRARKL